MSNKRSSLKKIIIVLGLLFSGIALFIFLGVVGLAASAWILLPIILVGISLMVSQVDFTSSPVGFTSSPVLYMNPVKRVAPLKAIKAPDELDKVFQERALDASLQNFIAYAEGKIPEKDLLFDESDPIQVYVKNNQAAHFALETYFEIDRTQQTPAQQEFSVDSLEKVVTPLRQKAATAFQEFNAVRKIDVTNSSATHAHVIQSADEKKPDNHNDSQYFKSIFQGVSPKKHKKNQKTRINRPIFSKVFKGDSETFLPGYQLVMFRAGAEENQWCLDYCIDMWDREETIKAIVAHLNNENFKETVFSSIIKQAMLGNDVSQYVEEDSEINQLIILKKAAEEKLNVLKLKEKSLSTTSQTLNKEIGKQFDEILNYILQIGTRIKQLINFSDNKQFEIFIRKHYEKQSLDSFLLSDLSDLMNKKQPMNKRELCIFKLKQKTDSYELKIIYGCYPAELYTSSCETYATYVTIQPGKISRPVDGEFFFMGNEQNLTYCFADAKKEIITGEIQKQEVHELLEFYTESWETFIEILQTKRINGVTYAIMEFILHKHANEGVKLLTPKIRAYLSNGHASPLVDIDDYDGLMKARIHENRFGWVNTQAQYELYQKTYCQAKASP